MEILVECKSLREAISVKNIIAEQYKSKIKRAKKNAMDIDFYNGDSIKFINSDSRYSDGLKADAAIGERAKYYTFLSKLNKTIWDYDDLRCYLDNL